MKIECYFSDFMLKKVNIRSVMAILFISFHIWTLFIWQQCLEFYIFSVKPWQVVRQEQSHRGPAAASPAEAMGAEDNVNFLSHT